MAGSVPILQCLGLVVGHHGRALTRPIDHIFSGNVALLGANGCGKSTLLHSFAGMLPVLAGDVTIAGASLRREVLQAKSRLGLMTDRLPVPGLTSIEDLLELVAWSRGLEREQVDQACASFALTDIRTQRLDSSSLGQQRRSCFAASTIGRPPVLLLDEPSVGMDTVSRALLIDHLLERREDGLVSVVVSHDRDFVHAILAEEQAFEAWLPLASPTPPEA